MKELRIAVRDKIATLVNDVELVCGNSDYRVIFEFDEDWGKYNAKTALFVFGDTTVEVPFTGNIITEKDAVAIEKATRCYIGVFTGDLITTTKAEVKCLTSIRDIAKTPTPPNEDVYNKIIGLINDLKLEGSAIIEVETLPENPEDIEDGWLYQTVEGLFWYDGEWHKIIDETELSQIDNRIAQVESIAKGAGQAVSYGNYSTMVDALNVMPRGRYRVGQSVMIVTVDVPDLWVSGITAEPTEYTYTDDATIVEALKTNGSIQVGYYQLSQLETQKVDLTEYVKNTDIASADKAGLIRLGDAMTISNGKLYFFTPSDTDFKKSTRPVDHLKVSNTDHIVKYGLTDCRIAWTDDTTNENGEVVKGDKTKARELIGAVGVTDYAGEGKAGVVRVKPDHGMQSNNDGFIWPMRGTAKTIKGRNSYRWLDCAHIDDIVVSAIKNCKAYTSETMALTADEQSSAQKWLGVPTTYDELKDVPFGEIVDAPEKAVNILWCDSREFGWSVNPEVTAYFVSDQTFTKEELLDKVDPFYYERNNDGTITTSQVTAKSITEDEYHNISISSCIYVINDYTKVSGWYGDAPTKNGIYFTYDSYSNSNTNRLYRFGKTRSKLDNKYLDLENNAVIKSLLARIEALENK